MNPWTPAVHLLAFSSQFYATTVFGVKESNPNKNRKQSGPTNIGVTVSASPPKASDKFSGAHTAYPISRIKRFFYSACLLLITIVILEIASFTVYSIVTKRFFSFTDLNTQRSLIVENAPADEGFEVGGLKIPWNVPIHPYYGFGKPSGFDFLQQPADGVQNDPNGIIVALTGGSVAFELFHKQKALLQQQLESIPGFEKKNIHVVLLGYFAWKQPQQATALTYYLTMGGKVDILVNLDGHNEIVDANTNYYKKVYPAYPWLWYYLASNTISADELRLIGEIRYWKTLRHSSAEFAEKFAHGISANVIWYFFDRFFESGIEERNVHLAEMKSEDKNYRPFSRFGPDREFGSLQSRLDFSTKIWATSSIQLNRIMKANSCDYFHFLQPNQYVPQSKHFSLEERRIAYDPRRAKFVALGYEYLIKAYSQLKAQGVNFFDLTNMYKDVDETVYRDTCCHFNDLGYELLAKKIGETVVQHYTKNAPPFHMNNQ